MSILDCLRDDGQWPPCQRKNKPVRNAAAEPGCAIPIHQIHSQAAVFVDLYSQHIGMLGGVKGFAV